MGRTIRQAKDIVLSCDLFCNTDLLRVRGDPEYRSFSGGVCSLILIISFAVIFANTALSTFSKTVITSKTTLSEQNNPTYFSTTSSPFLFALGVRGYDLNDPTTKYFNVAFSQRTKAIGQSTIKDYYTLEPCNRTLWLSINPDFEQPFDRLGLQQYLCLDPSISLQFQGKFSSDMFKYSKITVEACSILPGDTRTCVNDSTLTDTFSFNYYFANTVINPDDTDYVGTYLQDKNYFQFTKNIGTTANVFISSYQINTDQSLMPIEDIQSETGGIVYQDAQQFVSEEPEYVQLFLRKSSLSLTIERSFLKYDDTISYIGGLFTAFIAVLFIMNKYNEYSYEVQAASKIYKYSPTEKIKSDSMHPPSFFAYGLYQVLDLIGKAPNWGLMEHLDKTRRQMNKQLDIMLLLKKVAFLENCMNFLFEEHQLKCLHLNSKLTLQQAAQIRRRFSMRRLLFQKPISKDSNSESDGPERSICDMTAIKIKSKQKKMDEPSFNRENLSETNSRAAKKEQLEENINEDSDSDCSSQDDNQRESKHMQLLDALELLKKEAKEGHRRCLKIYNSLDPQIRTLGKPQSINSFNQQNGTELHLVTPPQPAIANSRLPDMSLAIADFEFLQENK